MFKMSEDKELEQHMSRLMNPRVRDVEVGIRTLRKIKIFPLSLADQFSITDTITEGLQLYIKEVGEGEFTAQAASKLVEMFRAKLPVMLKLIFPEEDPRKLLKELDNFQLATIAEIVFQDNYGEPAKKLASLFRPTPIQETESPLERLSRLSADTTPATESNTSPDSATKKVESQAVN
jgi:hypothetical protein